MHWGEAQAESYVARLRDTCRAIAKEPRRGRAVEGRSGYLRHRSGSHIIYYRDPGDRIEIVRIPHGAQDPGRNL